MAPAKVDRDDEPLLLKLGPELPDLELGVPPKLFAKRTQQDVADIFRLSRNRVSEVLSKAGLLGVSATDTAYVRGPDWPKVLKELIIGLGSGHEKIAKATGVDQARVSRRVACHKDIRPLYENMHQCILDESMFFQVLDLSVGAYFAPWVSSWLRRRAH